MTKIVVYTGAGISAESGLGTFRGKNGLWEGYALRDVSSRSGWERDPDLVQEFFNQRRKAMLAALPNQAHLQLVRLEEKYQVDIITQNIDNLHERAGSTSVLHLHGNITLSQSSMDSSLTYPIDGWEIKPDACCELGSRLRPHVVLFEEEVPNIDRAEDLCSQADIFILIGTSLLVPPASGIVNYVQSDAIKYIVDPKPPYIRGGSTVIKIQEKATTGVLKVVNQLMI